MIYNLDDYHNIHEKRHPNCTSLSEATHMATCISKKIENSNHIPIIYNGIPVHNPANIDWVLIRQKLINTYQKHLDISYRARKSEWIKKKNNNLLTFNQIEQLTIHMYEDAIIERREERKMKGTILVGIQEQQLHSLEDYLKGLDMILQHNKYLNGYVAPVVTDWPGQLFIRKALTHIQNGSKNIKPEIKSFLPILGPLHVSLNTREQIIRVHHPFIEKMFHDVFGSRKILAKKPKPWRINLLLELLQKGWEIIRIQVINKFGNVKDPEYQTLLDLLDNTIPAALDIYATLFRSGAFNEYVETIFRIWTFALKWKRKNYNKAPLAFLSDIFYWEETKHPMKEAIKNYLINFNDYWVENMHSQLRTNTSSKDNSITIQQQAYLLGN